jgi:hypothetical protein
MSKEKRKNRKNLIRVDRVANLVDVWWDKEHVQATMDELMSHNTPVPDELVEPVIRHVTAELYIKLDTFSPKRYLCDIKEPTVGEPFNLVKLRDPDEPYGKWEDALVDGIKELLTGEKLYFAMRV